jgi:DNA-binding SARP family transcriptional activator
MSQTTGNEEPSPAEGSLEVRVLGEFTVLRDGETVDLPPSRKTRALLAYLAVVDRSQQRERLCRMFWDLPDDPRGALRWSLSKLRQIMNNGGRDCLVADRNSVLVRGREIVLDLRRLKTIATRDVATVATAELEDAATLLRGGFLDDLSLPRCPEFEAWRTSHINDVDLHRVKILRTLVDRLAGEPSRALCYAHALQAIHPRDGALAAEVTTLAERARAHAATTPVPRPPDDGREPPAAEAPPAPQCLIARSLWTPRLPTATPSASTSRYCRSRSSARCMRLR